MPATDRMIDLWLQVLSETPDLVLGTKTTAAAKGAQPMGTHVACSMQPTAVCRSWRRQQVRCCAPRGHRKDTGTTQYSSTTIDVGVAASEPTMCEHTIECVRAMTEVQWAALVPLVYSDTRLWPCYSCSKRNGVQHGGVF